MALAFFIILGLCLFSWIDGPQQRFYFADCLTAPEQCEGKAVLVPVGQISAASKTGFTVRTQDREIFIQGMAADIRPGKYIDVFGIFHQPGYLELKAAHVHRERTLKLSVSLLPLAIVGWLAYKHFYA